MDATHDDEEWRPVVGWEGLYEVSDLGRVRSLDRMVSSGLGRTKLYRGRVLVGKIAPSTGYRVCTLTSGAGRRKYALIHRLVLEAFVGPCPEGMECCHGDGDRANASLTNLRWDTRSANTIDAVTHQTNLHARKARCPRGHEYTIAHEPGRSRPRRVCRKCDADRKSGRI